MRQKFGQSRLILVEEESKKYICCCGARAWTFVVAIFSMIGCLLLMLNIFISAGNGQGPLHTVKTDFDDPIFYTSFVWSCILFPLSVTLFGGALKRVPMLLLIWLIIQGIQITIIAVGIVVFLIGCVALVYEPNAVVIFIVSAIAASFLGISIFCFWVVAVCRKELLNARRQSEDTPSIPGHTLYSGHHFANVQMNYKM